MNQEKIFIRDTPSLSKSLGEVNFFDKETRYFRIRFPEQTGGTRFVRHWGKRCSMDHEANSIAQGKKGNKMRIHKPFCTHVQNSSTK